MKLNLKARLVAAICKFKATHDIRYYLNGVYVEPSPDGGAYIVGTNGHALGLWYDPSAEVERAIILRIEKKLEAACAGAETKRLLVLDGRLAVVDKTEEIYIQPNGGGTAGIPFEISGKFPDWRKVIPEVDYQRRIYDVFRPEYLAHVGQALRIGTNQDKFSAIALNQRSSGAAIVAMSTSAVEGANNFIGVVMPMREDNGIKQPAWLAKAKAAAPAEAVEPPKLPEPPPEPPTTGKDDPLYKRAVAVVREYQRVSVSLVQREMACGYNQAAKMIEAMGVDRVWAYVNGEPTVLPLASAQGGAA
jgi:Ftsk gamma domain